MAESFKCLMEMGMMEGTGGLFAGRISDSGGAGRIIAACSLAHGNTTASSNSASADSEKCGIEETRQAPAGAADMGMRTS